MNRQEASSKINELLGRGPKDKTLDDFLVTKYNRDGKIIYQSVNIDNVAEYIESKFNIRTIFGIKEETIEVFQEGVWSIKGRGVIKAEIEKLLGIYSRNNIVNEILEKIKRRTEIERNETENLSDFKRCLKNGVLDFEDVNNIKLLPHSKEYNFRNKWEIEYNPEAKCPMFLKVINDIFEEEDVVRFQEWIGFHLRRYYVFKKFVILYGAKDTGKSLIANWMNFFLNRNVAGLSLHEISKGKSFDLLDLKDKDGNICDDLSSEDMSATGGIKMSVGDGFIQAEQKFGDKIKFRNTAKHTYTCNKIPSPKSDLDDSAYYGRIILFCLSNVVTQDKQDQNIINKITTPEELSGALNWAIEGYKRLISQGGFSYEKDPEEIKYLMIKGGNSLAEFSSEVIEACPGEKITKEDMYKVYCKWCLEHKPKLSPDTKEKIGRNLIKFNSFISSEKSGSQRYWLNLKLRDTWYTFLKNMSNFRVDSKDNIYNYFESVPSVPKDKEKHTKEVFIQISQKFIELEEKIGTLIPFQELKESLPDLNEEELRFELDNLKTQGWLSEVKPEVFQRI